MTEAKLFESGGESGSGNAAGADAAPARALGELSDGEEFTCALVVRERQLRQKKNGEDFLKLQLGDRTGAVPAIAWDRVSELFEACAPGKIVVVTGKFSVHPQFGRQIKLASARAAESHEYEAEELAEGPSKPAERLESDLRELLETVQNPSLRALLDRFFGPETAVLEPLPRGAGREALPPGLRRRAARAHALGRPGRQRRRQLLPRHRPRRRGHRRAAARHRQDRGLQRRPAGDRPHRRRPPAGRDPARLLQGAPPDRGDRRLRPRPGPGGPPHHPQPPRLARARLAGRPCTREAVLVHIDRQPRRQARQLRPARARAPRRRVLVALRPRHRRRGLLRPLARPSSAASDAARTRTQIALFRCV